MKLISIFYFATIFLVTQASRACSMYKVTVDGNTMVGTNEDAWRTTPHIWFEIGKDGELGCCFTGSRRIGKNRFAAQSGMNEHGLTFSRLSSYYPEKDLYGKSLKLIENPDQFLMDLMHTCKNIEEVSAFFSQYDRSCFIGDVFVYVDPSGEYLVVEPYQLLRGNDASYVQSNFCPSITKESTRRNQLRYRDGRNFLDKQLDTTLDFCAKVSDKMHVCRGKIGDGTLLTAIWNTSELCANVFFYHNYSQGVSFNLMEELSKGDHQLEIASLFPKSEEFEQLQNYITPFNTPWLRILIALIGFFSAISSLFFLINSFKSTKLNQPKFVQALLSLTFFLVFIHCFVLASKIEIFYFPAPYHGLTIFTTISAYIPYALVVLIPLIGIIAWKRRKEFTFGVFSKSLIFMNALILSALFVGFFYWKLL